MIELRHRARDLVLAPRFDAAMRGLCHGVTECYAKRGDVVRAVGSMHRWAVALTIVHLHLLAAGATAGAPTRADLLRTPHPLGGEKAVEGAVAVLVHAGLVVESPSPLDGRRRLLAPTPALMERLTCSLMARWRAASLAELVPKPPLAPPDAAQIAHWLTREIATYLATGADLGRDFPELRPFVDRIGGYFMLLDLMATTPGDRTIEPAALRRLPERWGISRSHVAKLVAAARLSGSFEAGPGPLRWTFPVHARLRLWIATELLWTAKVIGDVPRRPVDKRAGED